MISRTKLISCFPRLLRQLSSMPATVKVTPKEVSLGELCLPNLELATRAIHRDGLVVLEDVIEHNKLDKLNVKMLEDAAKLQAKGDDGPYNYNKGNIQQDPPLINSFFDPSIYLNKIGTQVTSSVLGPQPRLTFISGNTALPPTKDSPPQSQPVHSDADYEAPECPYALVINVPLVDMSPENGSTEVWLGTQNYDIECQEGKHGERASGRIKQHMLDQRTKERPCVQPVIKKGSIVIRDLRLWHAGKPNHTDKPRIMLAMIHFAHWFRNGMTLECSESAKSMIEAYNNLLVQAKYFKDNELDERYLNRPFGNAYDFNQNDHLNVHDFK